MQALKAADPGRMWLQPQKIRSLHSVVYWTPELGSRAIVQEGSSESELHPELCF